jgi:hypothetical protein
MGERLLQALAGSAVLIAASLSTIASARAESTIVPTYNAMDADTVKKIVDAQGQAQSSIDLTDPAGPVVKVQLAGAIPYTILLDDCDGGQPNLCKSLEFHALLPAGSLNFSQINSFNQNMRYATAYLGDKGVPALRMDENLRGGVTADFVAYGVRIFSKVVVDYIQQAK